MDAQRLRASFRPLHDRVIVEVAKPQERISKGGIIQPAEAADGESNAPKAIIGTVIAVGPGRWCSRGKKKWFAKTTAQVGQRVVFAQHSGETLPDKYDLGESVFWQIHDDEIVALLDGEGDATAVADQAAA